jgi:hypothetical protein
MAHNLAPFGFALANRLAPLVAMVTDALLQQRMDTAFDNYLHLTRILEADMTALLDGECEDQHWRRNFIRSAAALIEGHAHCLREMCAISFECIAPELAKKEADVLRSEESFSAVERMKLTLRAAYTLFELAPAPNFGGNEWPKAQRVLLKRHLLMHPKTPADLEVSDSLWSDIRTDIAWLIEQFFSFLSLLQKKHDVTL